MPHYPKHPSTRSRRNKPNVTREIVLDAPLEKPPLPQRYVIEEVKQEDGSKIERQREADWHPQALAVWDRIWATTELIEDFLPIDISALLRLVASETEFWEKFERGKSTVMANDAITKLEKEYGLTRVRRYALGWVVAATDESYANAEAARQRPPRPVGDVTREAPLELPPGAVFEDPDPDDLLR